jgi:hypothetical protein
MIPVFLKLESMFAVVNDDVQAAQKSGRSLLS